MKYLLFLLTIPIAYLSYSFLVHRSLIPVSWSPKENVLDYSTLNTVTKHYTANVSNLDGSSAYTNASAIGFNILDTNMSTSVVNSLPAGTQSLAWVGIGTSNCSSNLSSTFTNFVLANASNPKLYGYYLLDEPLDATCVAAVKAYSDYIHTTAPGKKAFIVVTDWPGTYAAYRPSETNVDLIGVDPYPVKNGTYDTTEIPRQVNAAVVAGIPLASMVPVFQTFGDSNYDAPTATQLTSMLQQWASLVPNPVLDYAYTWGTQNGARTDALVNRSDWRDIMAVHNLNTSTSPSPTPTPTVTNTPTPTASPTPTIISNTSPVVTISSPQNNSTLTSKSNLSIKSSATDPAGMAKIEIYLDALLVQTCNSTSNCSKTLRHNEITSGYHVVAVKATNKNGMSTTQSVSVTKQ